MTDIIGAIILGFVQGVTEFLPISSSGHLIVLRDFLGIQIANSLLFDVLLHLATALAIVVYFRKDVISLFRKPKEHKVLWLAILLGTIPAVIFGLWLDTDIRNTAVVAGALIAGSILFFVAEGFAKQSESLTVKKGIIIGFFQALALIPGMSRSGSTISGGLLLGMNREEAAKFSFFLGLPVIIGAGLFEAMKNMDALTSGGLDAGLLLGLVTAFVTGIVSMHYLLRFLRNHKLTVFAWYRIALAVAILFLL